MKLSEKLKKAEELEEEAENIRNDASNEARKKWSPLEQEAQKLKESVYKKANSLAKDIKKDVNDFVEKMKKKYKKMDNLEIVSHVLYYRSKAEICVDFEIALEDIVKYEEGKRKKIKKKIVRDIEEPRSLGHAMAKLEKAAAATKLKPRGKK